MTKEEAIYWKRFIVKTIEERLPQVTVSDLDAARIRDFAKENMTLITGQQELPQTVFRKFLELFEKIPQMQEDIEKAQEEINEWLQYLPVECTVADVYAMFEEFVAPMVLDEEGYIVLTDLVRIDDEGWLNLPSPALDLERYFLVVRENN